MIGDVQFTVSLKLGDELALDNAKRVVDAAFCLETARLAIVLTPDFAKNSVKQGLAEIPSFRDPYAIVFDSGIVFNLMFAAGTAAEKGALREEVSYLVMALQEQLAQALLNLGKRLVEFRVTSIRRAIPYSPIKGVGPCGRHPAESGD
jgi:hypothetical protein